MKGSFNYSFIQVCKSYFYLLGFGIDLCAGRNKQKLLNKKYCCSEIGDSRSPHNCVFQIFLIANLFSFQINNSRRCILLGTTAKKLYFNMVKCDWSTWLQDGSLKTKIIILLLGSLAIVIPNNHQVLNSIEAFCWNLASEYFTAYVSEIYLRVKNIAVYSTLTFVYFVN